MVGGRNSRIVIDLTISQNKGQRDAGVLRDNPGGGFISHQSLDLELKRRGGPSISWSARNAIPDRGTW